MFSLGCRCTMCSRRSYPDTISQLCGPVILMVVSLSPLMMWEHARSTYVSVAFTRPLADAVPAATVPRPAIARQPD
jgi:hypothetical protein